MNHVFADRVMGIQPSAIREILKFTAFPDVISFAAGNPAPEAFPVDEVERISREIFEKNPISALQYNITEGYTPLRDLLKTRMTEQQCYNEDIDELIITAGAQQAAELSCKVMCNEGDTIICESPTFIGVLNAFKSYKANLVGIKLEDDGMDMNELENALKSNPDTKLIYVIPNFQNPTGNTMSFEKRKALYELARKYNTVIFEDNPYGDIRFDGENVPSIKSLDIDGRVIYAGSFSKILAPGLRVGYMSAPKDIVQKAIVCKQVSDVHTNIWAQIVCEKFMVECDLDKHFKHLKQVYKHKYELMKNNIEEHFSDKISVTHPQGGLFIWATLPDGSDMPGFCKKAVEEYKIAVVPGSAFMIHETDHTNSFRLNYSTPTDDKIAEGCKILGKMTREMLD